MMNIILCLFMQMSSMFKNNQQRLNYLRDSLKYFTPLKKNIYLDRKRKMPKNDEM